MKKDLSEWIDTELDRLDKKTAGDSPDDTEPNLVPDDLRHALGKISGEQSSEKN